MLGPAAVTGIKSERGRVQKVAWRAEQDSSEKHKGTIHPQLSRITKGNVNVVLPSTVG